MPCSINQLEELNQGSLEETRGKASHWKLHYLALNYADDVVLFGIFSTETAKAFKYSHIFWGHSIVS